MRTVHPGLQALRQAARPGGTKAMMVEPCWNQPISSPRLQRAEQGMWLGPRYRRCSSTFRKFRRMLATRMAATGTSVMMWPEGSSLAG